MHAIIDCSFPWLVVVVVGMPSHATGGYHCGTPTGVRPAHFLRHLRDLLLTRVNHEAQRVAAAQAVAAGQPVLAPAAGEELHAPRPVGHGDPRLWIAVTVDCDCCRFLFIVQPEIPAVR